MPTSHNLVITEKPSVAKTISSVLKANERKDGYFTGNNYIVAYCFGHLLELAQPDAYGEQYKKWRYEDLPIIPDKWKHIPSKDKAAQLKIIKELMSRDDVDCVINACDAGREGELIFRHVYEHAKCKKPIKRLWISSMEDKAIKEGFDNLKDGKELENLSSAASCREQADWTVGISATRLFSVLYGNVLNTGRVQSPTLAMLVKREADIDNFVKKPFYTVEIDNGGFRATSARFGDKTEAENLAEACTLANVTSVKQTEKSVSPPKLHDLTTLQREANRAYNFTAQQTLDYVQSLYEKKLCTYPRTDSRYLTDDMAEATAALVASLNPNAPCDVSQVVNNKKVSDHHAIIPTSESVKANISALPSGEREILDMVTNRLICSVGEKHRYLETSVTLLSGGAEFTAKGKTVIYEGWKSSAKSIPTDGDEEEETQPISNVSEGQIFPVTAVVKEGATSPPKHFTEDTLLSAMENAGAEERPKEIGASEAKRFFAGGEKIMNMPEDAERKGLGTPATRAAIIEKLVQTGFVQRQKKNLIPTDKGKNLIAVLPDTLISAKLTAEWEHKLMQIQRGELPGKEFMGGIASFITAIVKENNKPKPEFVSLFPDTRKHATEPLGKCPRCGSPVREGGDKGFFCDSRACGFKLWKNSKFWTAKKQPLTADIVAALLRDGKVALKGLFSEKTGKTYDAVIILDDTGDKYVNFKMEFAKK